MLSGPPSPGDRPRRRLATAAASLALIASVAAAAALAAPAAAAPSPQLEARLATAAPDQRIGVIATLARQVDGERYEGRREALIRALQRTARTSQGLVEDRVEGPVRAFWLVNAVAFSGTPDEIRAVAAVPGVAEVGLDVPVRVAAAPTTASTPFPDPGAGNWGLGAIRAPGAWSTYGVSGAGVTVGTIDTGVDPANPEVAGKVVAWRDFVAGAPTPYDDNGHGTHTAGTIAGGAVGVAPGARLVVARAMGAGGVGPGSALLAAAEWMTDPDGNPATADQPAVINNSWSAPNANDPWFRPMIRRWLELGITPVFAAGNTGAGAGSVGSPAGYPEALAVGALDHSGATPAFSGRGPIVWQNPDGTGPAAGAVLTKPDLAAPGVGIVSGFGSGYYAFTGTSMAAPHVAGVAALVVQANPALRGAGVANLLRATAVDVGAPGPDQASGLGRVDALGAVAAARGPAPDTQFTATPGALTRDRAPRYSVALSGGGVSVRTRVDGGPWSAPAAALTFAPALPDGRHVVEAQAVAAGGAVDPTPVRHVVTVDRAPPKVRIRFGRRGTAIVFIARVKDRGTGARRASIRWSFGRGERIGRGTRVVRRFAEGGRRRVILTARDGAGNVAYASRRFRPRAATAVRALKVARRASRRSRSLTIRGRLVRRAGIRVSVRPVKRQAASARVGPAKAFAVERVGSARRRARLSRARSGRFRVSVRIRGLKAGSYRLEVRAPERGRRVGDLRLTRRLEIRR